MSDNKSLINFGDLSKPATVLIEKISGAAGILYEPTRIRNAAKANADAAMIEAKAEIEIQDIHKRAMLRFVEEEAKNQENIEKITADAIPLLEDSSNAEKMDDDWVRNFFDKCRLVSNEDMQSIWTKILAGEANSPGSFGKRTVNFVANMSKAEASIFTQLCSFNVPSLGSPIVFDLDDKIYKDNGLDFKNLANLDSLGLIKFNYLAGYSLNDIQQKDFAFLYGTSQINIHIPDSKQKRLELGKVILTDLGKELVTICNSTDIHGFGQYLQTQYEKKGYKEAE